MQRGSTKIFFQTLVILTVFSCSQPQKSNTDFQRRNLSEYFTSSGAVQYFLPDIPEWANFSEVGRCTRDNSIRYLNFDKLSKSYGLKYDQLMSMQYFFNKRKKERQFELGADSLSMRDEEKIFFEVSDQIQAGIRPFRNVKSERIDIYWIDLSLLGKKKTKRLKDKLKMTSQWGTPYITSFCLEEKALSDFREDQNIYSGTRLIPAISYSPYGSKKYKRLPYFSINFRSLFNLIDSKTKIYLWIPTEVSVPSNFSGYDKIFKF